MAYEKASNQHVNLSKSCCIPSKHITARRRSSITGFTGLAMSSFPITYLGTPLFAGRAKVSYFNSMIEKVVSKLEGWKAKFLSAGGKLTADEVSFALNSYSHFVCYPCAKADN